MLCNSGFTFLPLKRSKDIKINRYTLLKAKLEEQKHYKGAIEKNTDFFTPH